MAVQSARFGQMDLESAVKNYLSEKNSAGLQGIPYLGIVHRLDQPVEGLVIFGKTKKGCKRPEPADYRWYIGKVLSGSC